MAIVLAVAVFITLTGGQIAVMVTDFIQGQLSNIVFLILLVVMLWMFPWNVIVETLERAPAGESKLNPFDTGSLPDFNPAFFFILLFLTVYNYMVWQGAQGYNSSAINPHEAKMANLLGQFRAGVTYLLIPLAADLRLRAHERTRPRSRHRRDDVDARRHRRSPDRHADDHHRRALADPPGRHHGTLRVASCSWPPSAPTPPTSTRGAASSSRTSSPPSARPAAKTEHIPPAQHLRWLKTSIVGVALFAWTFSMIFPLREYIQMYFQATGAIFTGGAGAVLIGGLYWKRGTTAGAWASMIVGCTLAVISVLTINLLWPNGIPALQAAYPAVGWIQAMPVEFWINGIQIAFLVSLIAVATYLRRLPALPQPPRRHGPPPPPGEIFRPPRPKAPITSPHPPPAGAPSPSPPSSPAATKLSTALNIGWVLFFFTAFLTICIWQLFSQMAERVVGQLVALQPHLHRCHRHHYHRLVPHRRHQGSTPTLRPLATIQRDEKMTARSPRSRSEIRGLEPQTARRPRRW